MDVKLVGEDFGVPVAFCFDHGEHAAVWAEFADGNRLYCPYCFYEWFQDQEADVECH